MSYELIHPPVSPNFLELSGEGIKTYNAWFIDVLQARASVLESYVKGTPGYEGWIANFDPTSLVKLGNWYALKVKLRDRSEAELKAIRGHLSFPIAISDKELTEETVSLAVDIGMYFASILLKNHPSLCWDCKVHDKKFADYGQPVIAGFGQAILNPVRIAITFAYSVASGKQSGERLGQLYRYWSDNVKA